MKILKTITPLILLAFVYSCDDKLEDLNYNSKGINSASPDALLNSATKQLADQIVKQDVNFSNYRLWVEHWTETTYTDEANYDIVTRPVPQRVFGEIYRDVLRDVQEAKKLLDNQLKVEKADAKIAVLKNKKSITEVLMVFSYAHLVESFGDIPYEESLKVDETLAPKYDEAKTVYVDLISRLKNAIESMDTENKGLDIDNIYGGNMSSWKKFASSLYLRMGMVLADSDSTLSKAAVEDAVSKGVFASNDDNALYGYASTLPNRNPVYNTITASGRNDYIAGKTFIDKLKELKDPRISAFFNSKEDGSYVGGIIGNTNSYGDFSHINDKIGAVSDRKGRLMDYSEIEFLLAEAKQRGYNVPSTAQVHYENAIKASIKFWGGSDADAATYIAQSSVAYDGAKYKEVIGNQMWIAMYNRGEAAWLHWRRYDFPALKGATQAKTTDSQPPRRLTYPVSEQKRNKVNWEAASSRIGGDQLETKLFFDKN